MRDRQRAYQKEIATFVFSVTAKNFSHGVLLDREYRRFPRWRSVRDIGTRFFCHKGTTLVARRETRVVGTPFLMRISTVEKSTGV
jgi:hypothetical protein